MLSGHPHIERLRVQEFFKDGRLLQKLIVETNLNLSSNRTPAENSKIKALEDFLKVLAGHDFADFREIEIRPFKETAFEDDYGQKIHA